MWTALVLERHASKEDILHAYLNRISYGTNLIGVEAASRRYFGRPAAEVSIAEAALLAGIPKWPSRFDPLVNGDAARARRDFVVAADGVGGDVE